MWSLAKGAGICAQYGALILLGLMQAQAVVGYTIVKPWDLSGFYRDLIPTGDPIEWPYARTLDGGQIFCRAMKARAKSFRPDAGMAVIRVPEVLASRLLEITRN